MTQLNRDVDIKTLSTLATMRHDLLPIKAAAIPLLLIGGEEDEGAHAAMREISVLFLGSSQLQIVPNTGHLLFFEDAESYNRLVGDFLAQTLRARSANLVT